MTSKNTIRRSGAARHFLFQVATDDQTETGRLWSAIVGNGGPARRG
mgnify:CR=1 FL=1|jgi:predicted 3-demethylubiquinone-9 3-methyltransferase (glyoxalase superfamily)